MSSFSPTFRACMQHSCALLTHYERAPFSESHPHAEQGGGYCSAPGTGLLIATNVTVDMVIRTTPIMANKFLETGKLLKTTPCSVSHSSSVSLGHVVL